jgi:hypothetical protein
MFKWALGYLAQRGERVCAVAGVGVVVSDNWVVSRRVLAVDGTERGDRTAGMVRSLFLSGEAGTGPLLVRTEKKKPRSKIPYPDPRRAPSRDKVGVVGVGMRYE